MLPKHKMKASVTRSVKSQQNLIIYKNLRRRTDLVSTAILNLLNAKVAFI